MNESLRGELETILSLRYAAGHDLAALSPCLKGRRSVSGGITAYGAWHDPVTARVLSIAENGVHRFGAHADSFRRLRATRTSTPEARRYFLCHALYAAAAEERRERRSGKILYIR